MEDGDLSKTEKLVPDSFSEDSIRDKTDHCEPERRGEAARQHTLEAEGEVKVVLFFKWTTCSII